MLWAALGFVFLKEIPQQVPKMSEELQGPPLSALTSLPAAIPCQGERTADAFSCLAAATIPVIKALWFPALGEEPAVAAGLWT